MSDAIATPTFAVVGHPNKGKSSIVATLTENQRVDIGATPGTTYKADHFEFVAGNQVLYTLVDTPGFQRAGQVMEWLQANSDDASQRRSAVQRFVEAHRGDDKFIDECELLTPLLEGAGILYVVDGAKPYGPEYELEMQILQWTGQPRMALINRIGEGDYRDEWIQALGQYFSIARSFDAMQADFPARISLLRAFGELHAPWRASLDAAVAILEQQRTHQMERSVREVCDLLCDSVSESLEEAVPDNQGSHWVDERKHALMDKLQAKLVKREQRARNRVLGIYSHDLTEANEAELKFLQADLFAEETWELFGLSRIQLAATGGVSGALAGGGLDLLVGGSSLFAGSLGGAVVGSLGAWFGSSELAKVKVLGRSLGGDVLRVGPVSSKNFPWVLLGRAWAHWRIISERNHAVRNAIEAEILQFHQEGVNTLDVRSRSKLESKFSQLRDGKDSRDLRDQLYEELLPLFNSNKLGPGEGS